MISSGVGANLVTPASNDDLNGRSRSAFIVAAFSMTSLSRRFLLAILLAIFTFSVVLYTGLPSTSSIPLRFQPSKSTQETPFQAQSSPQKIPEWDPSFLVKGSPTKSFRGSPVRVLGKFSWLILLGRQSFGGQELYHFVDKRRLQ